MDEVMKLLTEDTSVAGYNVHNWILLLLAVAALWSIILAKDL